MSVGRLPMRSKPAKIQCLPYGFFPRLGTSVVMRLVAWQIHSPQ